MIVMKFGGTSVKTTSAINAVLDVVQKNKEHKPLVVLSASGGITDVLLTLVKASAVRNTAQVETSIQALRDRHIQLCNELLSNESSKQQALADVERILHDVATFCEGVSLLGECTPRSLDAVAAFGELLSTTIFTHLCNHNGLQAVFHDARNTMRTNDEYTNAKTHLPTLKALASEHIAPELQRGVVVVTQGFIGATEHGTTTTLGRGGSDLSAALFGWALGAEEIQIWTDVSGVLSADPRLVPEATAIPELTFAEVRELSCYGAKVLHPDTIKPAVDQGIPVRVLNTFQPQHPGTRIVERTSTSETTIRSVTIKKDCVLLSAHAPMHRNATELLSAMLAESFSRGIDVLCTLSGESSCGIVVSEKDALHIREMSAQSTPVVLLCASGPNIQHNPHTFAEFADALRTSQPLALLHGASAVSYFAIIPAENATQSLVAVHKLIA